MNKKFTKLLTALVLLVFLTPPAWVMGQTYTYELATSIAEGDVVVIVNTDVTAEMTNIASNIGTSTPLSNNAIQGTYLLTVSAGTEENSFAFKNGSNYMAYTSTGNNLNAVSELAKTASWTVSISDGVATITNCNSTTRVLRYNTSSPRFCCYTSNTGTLVKLYKRVASATHTLTITQPTEGGTISVTDANNEEVNSGDEIAENATLTLTATPAAGYAFGNWTATSGDLNDAESSPTSFTMGNSDAEISAVFVQDVTEYTVSIAEGIQHGTITASPTQCVSGTEVTLTISPETGYHLASLTVTDGDNHTIPVADYIFTMPASNVTVTGTFTNTITDVLTYTLIGVTGTGYSEWSGKTSSSTAVYAGNSAGGNESIQLRSSQNSGIISTTSGGKVKKVAVKWNSNTADERVLDVYGSNTAYTAASNLYSSSTQGTKLGSFTKSEGNGELTIENDYLYIGLRSNSGALYLDEIDITWEPVTTYTITIDEDIVNGTVTASAASAPQGTEITLTATPDTHYSFDDWMVYDDEMNEYTVTDNKFTMPAANVTVYASFTEDPKYDITIAEAIQDKVAVDATDNKAYAGQTVTIIVDQTTAPLETLTVTGVTGDVEVTPAVSAEVNDYTFTMPAEAVTISATFSTTFITILYSINGTDEVVNVPDPDNYTLMTLSAEQIPTGFSFAGWTLDDSNIAILDPATYQVQDEDMFTAVFERSEGGTAGRYAKVTAEPDDWSGDYLIVYEDGNVAFNGGLGTLDAVGNTISVTITDGEIASTETTDAAKFTIAAIEETSNYSIKSARGKYIGRTAASNGFNESATEVYQNVLAYDSENETTTITSSGGPTLQYYVSGNQSRFRYYASNQKAIQLYKYEAGTPGTTEQYTRVIDEDVTVESLSISGPTIILSGKTLNVTNSLTSTDADLLIIEDGSQLIHTTPVKATLKKNIKAYTVAGDAENTANGWYTIASPVADANVDLAATGEYDLYAYDEPTHYWLNQETAANNITTFGEGQGYLYANSADQTLSYAGLMKPTGANISVDLSYQAEGDLKGFNLVGNPFSRNLTGEDIEIGGTALTSYLVVEDGTELVTRNIAENPIKPGQGFFVQATEAGQQLEFNPIEKGKAAKSAYIAIEAGNESFMDRAYVQIGNGNTLRKMTLGNTTPKVCVMHDGKDYAAATIAEAEGEMPVSFKAAKNGTYTLTVSTKGLEANQLRLIDNMTGAEVDLMVTPSYTFEAKKTDYESRFRLVFSTNGIDENGASTGSATFAYYNGTEWVVNATENATLEVIDMTGRVIRCSDAARNVSTNGLTAGVYMLRLTDGNGVKVQKIVLQ